MIYTQALCLHIPSSYLPFLLWYTMINLRSLPWNSVPLFPNWESIVNWFGTSHDLKPQFVVDLTYWLVPSLEIICSQTGQSKKLWLTSWINQGMLKSEEQRGRAMFVYYADLCTFKIGQYVNIDFTDSLHVYWPAHWFFNTVFPGYNVQQ